MKKIVLIGGGGHCKSVIDVIELQRKYEIVGIIDKPEFNGTKVLGYSVIGNDNDLKYLAKKYKYGLITVGQVKSPSQRIKLYNLAVKAGFSFPKIVSPNAYVSKHAKIGNGTIIMHNAVINSNVTIGENCIINSKALIEHDCLISSHCHVSTAAIINGGVKIEACCFIGSNSTTAENTLIKESSFIKAGSLVN